MEYKVGDKVRLRNSKRVGRVIEVNYFYGWFVVQWDDGGKREYNYYNGITERIRIIDDSSV